MRSFVAAWASPVVSAVDSTETENEAMSGEMETDDCPATVTVPTLLDIVLWQDARSRTAHSAIVIPRAFLMRSSY